MQSPETLLSTLHDFANDPELLEFRPVIEEMIAGITNPNYNNIDKVCDLYNQSTTNHMYRKLAELLYFNSSNSHMG